MKIGFIGLGIMGAPMVKNLLKANHEVLAYDIVKANVDKAVAAGAKAAASVKEIGRECRFIITMLPDGPDVKKVVCGEGGVLEGAAEGTILVDMSSIAPSYAQEVYAACAEKGVRMLDAPVSGGEPGAINGTLSIMVGGDQSTFDEAYDVLMAMGANAVLCGASGAGNVVKLTNNIIVAINAAALAEAFILSTKAGVDPAKVFEAIKGGMAGSRVLEAKAPMMISGSFEPGFKLDLHIKDLNNALTTGYELGVPLLFTAQAKEMMRNIALEGFGQKDHSVVVKFYEKITGCSVSG